MNIFEYNNYFLISSYPQAMVEYLGPRNAASAQDRTLYVCLEATSNDISLALEPVGKYASITYVLGVKLISEAGTGQEPWLMDSLGFVSPECSLLNFWRSNLVNINILICVFCLS